MLHTPPRAQSPGPFIQALVALLALLSLGLPGCEDPRHGLPLVEEAGVRDLSPPSPCGPCAGVCCGRVCVLIDKDPLNCGACAVPCATGEDCVGGVCACAGGGGCSANRTCCPSGCVDIQGDARNCGACGQNCLKAAPGESCYAGSCGCGAAGVHCTTGQACCAGQCIGIESDAANCGSCGNTCGNGQTCAGGSCQGGGGGGGGLNCNPPCSPGQMCVLGLICV